MRSHLLHGKVRHRRSRPVDYELEHDVFYLALDLDEIDAVDRRLRLFSRGRRNVLTFRDSDHWLPAATDLRASVRAHLRERRPRPRGLAHHLHRHAPGLRLPVQPGQLLPLPGRQRYAAGRRHRGPQHARRAPPLHAPSAATGTGLGRRHGQGLLRLALHRHGRALHGPSAGRPDHPAHRHHGDGARVAAAQRDARAATGSPDRPHARQAAAAHPLRDPEDDRGHPPPRLAAVASRRDRSTATPRWPGDRAAAAGATGGARSIR